jgi:hypothetical protein
MSAELIRAAGINTLTELTESSREVQKLVAFENAFDRLLNIIVAEGGIEEGGDNVQDCLTLIANLVRHNPPNQVLFRESGCMRRVAQLFAAPAPNGLASEKADQAWANPLRDKNIWGLLALLRLFLQDGNSIVQSNQLALEQHGVLQTVLDLGFKENYPTLIRSEVRTFP